MSSPVIPDEVLGDALSALIAGRPVRAGVFLTYEFDPYFFEGEVLPLLFDRKWSHDRKVRLVQLEDAMPSVRNMAVYYDRAGLIPSEESAKLDYRRHAVSRPTGYFHPKVIMLLVHNEDAKYTWESLILGVSSANLTESGWCTNVEAAQLVELNFNDKCAYRQDLLGLISSVKKENQALHGHEAIDEIRAFLLKNTSDSVVSQWEGRWKPHLFAGQDPFASFAAYFIPNGECHLEVISPFFDKGNEATTLSAMIEATSPKTTRVYLPEGKDKKALCTREFFKSVKTIPRVSWSRLPEALLSMGPGKDANASKRSVHAKMYRFWNEDREIIIVGSVNLTLAAHSKRGSGNLEAAILIENEVTTRLGWLLEPIGNYVPRDFEDTQPTDEDQEGGSINLTIRYFWQTGVLEYYYEPHEGSQVRSIEVSATGNSLFQINPLKSHVWVALPTQFALMIRDLLRSTSFVQVRAGNEPEVTLLIEEEEMANKPSLRLDLTPEEILRYWSLLTPEQKENFILTHLLRKAEGGASDSPVPKPIVGDSMFDRFAGIFHAFGRLEYFVNQAIEASAEREVVYRLFGEKYDSLPNLIRKTIATDDGDLVNRYITLQCARMTLDRIERNHAEFVLRHKSEIKALRKDLEAVENLRDQFSFGSREERATFFEWFDKMFLKDMTPPPAEEEE